MTNLDNIFKNRAITLLTKVHLVKAMVFPVVVWIWELDCKKSWGPKNWCFWPVVLEKTLESPLDCKESQPVHSKGNQPWVFFGRNDAKAETPVLWPPHVKSWLTGKDSDAGRDWGQEEKGTTKDEMAGWHHWLNGCGFGWTQTHPKELLMDREAWCAAIRGVTKSRTRLSNWTETYFGIFPDILLIYFSLPGPSPRVHICLLHFFCSVIFLVLLCLYFWRILIRYFIDCTSVWICLIPSHDYTRFIEDGLLFSSRHAGGKWY